MIDYDKLKETAAHEIHKSYLKTCEELGWGVKQENKVPYYKLSEDAKKLDIASFESALATLQAFGLITEDKLRQLTQPEPKYKEGSQVWFTECGDIRNGYIKSIRNDSYLIDLNEDVSYCEKEDDLYPTKAELIEAQIEYWQSLREIPHEFRRGVCVHCGDKPFENTSNCNRPENQNISDEKLVRSEHINDAAYYLNPAFEGEVKGECKHMLSESSTHDLVRWCNDCSRWGWFSEECEHESDGKYYPTPCIGNRISKKCIKCGEFYI